MAIPNVTDMIKNLDDYPNTKVYLDNLTRDSSIDIKKVHKSYNYTDDVTEDKLYKHYAIFVSYFIRKQISYRYRTDIIDDRTEWVINESNIKPNDIERCYYVFKNYNLSAMAYINEIQTVSYCNDIYINREFSGYKFDVNRYPDYNFNVNRHNMSATVEFIDRLPCVHYELNPVVHSDYFNGHADIILDNDVIYHTKVSKYMSFDKGRHEISKTLFYQLILYSFGNYKKTNNTVKINKFLIYNPLLGYEYRLSVNEIDYEEFERALQHDTQTAQ